MKVKELPVEFLEAYMQGDTWEGFQVEGLDFPEGEDWGDLSNVLIQFRHPSSLNRVLLELNSDDDNDFLKIDNPTLWSVSVGPVHFETMFVLDPGVYEFDIKFTSSDDHRRTLLRGFLTVLRSNTLPLRPTV